jgi:alpha-2-macroglobulin
MLRNIVGKILILAALLLPALATGDTRPSVTLALAGNSASNVGAIDRFTLRFSHPMVPLGDPRATAPAEMKCVVASTGRWADPQTFIFDFEKDLPGGLTCSVTLRDDLKTQRGIAIGDGQKFDIDTGGPLARSVLTSGNYSDIEEEQMFLVASNVPADRKSVATYGYCAVDGVGEKIALNVQDDAVILKIVKGLGKDNWRLTDFLNEAGLPANIADTGAITPQMLKNVVAVQCRRPLPPGKSMALVWDKNIADASGKQAGRDQRFDFDVRAAFTAKFECPRVNSRAGCNPVQDVSVNFTAPIARDVAMQISLTLADGTEVKPVGSDSEKNDAEISRVIFKARFPGPMDGKISLPEKVTDMSGRTLQNAARFPLTIHFDEMPPLIKFSAKFGILEAKAFRPSRAPACVSKAPIRMWRNGCGSWKISTTMIREWRRARTARRPKLIIPEPSHF